MRFWHRHARLYIHIVIDHDFPFTAVFFQELQQTSTKPPVRVHLCARWRSGFENPDTQVSVSAIATSGRMNLRETISCFSEVPRNSPLKIDS